MQSGASFRIYTSNLETTSLGCESGFQVVMTDAIAPLVISDPPLYEVLMYDEGKICCSSQSSVTSADSEMTNENTRQSLDENGDAFEAPPSYSPALTKKGILQMKPEFSSPYCKTRYRSWRTCLVELNNTQSKSTYQKLGGFVTKSHTFSLQFAEVGLATDYEKKPNSFRLRVETRQFMFDCRNRKEMLGWMVGLQMAISLALPLELRQLPEEVKRRRNRQRDRERRLAREQNARRRDQSTSDSNPNLPSHSNSNSHTYSHSHSHLHSASQIQSISSRQARKPNAELDRSSRQSQDHTCAKWEPPRRSSRFSEKDFPHLLLNTPWEGKSIIYQGRWAQVTNRAITFVISNEIETSQFLS